jgi:hypothetical protein
VYVSGLPSGSVALMVTGVMAVLTVLVRFASVPNAGMETRTSGEKFPDPAALMARTATRYNTPAFGMKLYDVCATGTVTSLKLQLSDVVPTQTS